MSGSLIESCEFYENEAGLILDAGTARNCKIYKNSTGVQNGMACGSGVLESCEIYDNTKYGVRMAEFSHMVLKSCKVFRNPVGVCTWDTASADLEDSEVFDCDTGIRQDGYNHITLKNCKVIDCKDHALDKQNGKDDLVTVTDSIIGEEKIEGTVKL